MAKKDFSQVKQDAIYTTMEEATTSNDLYTEDEIAKYKAEMRTQGRRGVKLQRISLAVTPEVKEYIKTMCQAANMNYSQFICKLIMDHKTSHPEEYKKAQKAFDAAEKLRGQL